MYIYIYTYTYSYQLPKILTIHHLITDNVPHETNVVRVV